MKGASPSDVGDVWYSMQSQLFLYDNQNASAVWW